MILTTRLFVLIKISKSAPSQTQGQEHGDCTMKHILNPLALPQWRRNGVRMALQWRYHRGAAISLQWRHNGAAEGPAMALE